MNKEYIKWGVIAVVAYLAYRWWQGQQTVTKWTPGQTKSVFGGGILTGAPKNTSTYQPYSAQPVASTITKSNPGFIGGLSNVMRPIFFNPATGVGSTDAAGSLGLVARPVGPAPVMGARY